MGRVDSGGIWPGDESHFQNIRETALQDTIEQLTKELAEKDRQLADKDRQLAEAGARIDFLDHTIDSMNNELAELCPEGQTVIELLAQKDKLIERMKNCQNCGRTGGFCKHCRYAPDKRGWDDNWKEPI